MSRFMLRFSAELDQLTGLQPVGGWDQEGARFYVTVECSDCKVYTDIVVLVSDNLTLQCPTCNKVGSIRTITGRGEPLMNDTIIHPFANAMLFECRNFKPIKGAINSLWEAKSMDLEYKYGPFNISGVGHAEYDENRKFSVGAWRMKFDFETKYLAPES